MKIRCIAVDDEPLSLRIIEKYAAELQQVELVTTCSNAFEAMEALRKKQVDLLLLDINMPKLSGISLLKTLDRPPLVVFITAYPEYAVEGFELEAVYYLLKPFPFERFAKAINRVSERLFQQKNPPEMLPGHLLIKADKKIYKLDFQDITYLEAYGDYVKIFTKDKMLLTKERLANLETELPESAFFRIHRSYLIRLDAIEFIEGNLVQIQGNKLPVSPPQREALMERLKKI